MRSSLVRGSFSAEKHVFRADSRSVFRGLTHPPSVRSLLEGALRSAGGPRADRRSPPCEIRVRCHLDGRPNVDETVPSSASIFWVRLLTAMTANFSDEPRRHLRSLYERYGAELLRPRERAWGLLADFAVGRRAENFLLGSVAREGLVELVLRKGLSGTIAVQALAQRVELDLGLDSERAIWAASAWGEACGWVAPAEGGNQPEAVGVNDRRSLDPEAGEFLEAIVRGFGDSLGNVRLREQFPCDEVAALAAICAVPPDEDIHAAVLWPSIRGARGLLFGGHGLRFRNPDNSAQPGIHHLSYRDLRRQPQPSKGNSAVGWDGLSTVLSTAGTGVPSRVVATFFNVIREAVAFRVL